MIWLLRMKRWIQNPPSPRIVRFGIAVIVACFALYFYELAFGWPDWLTVNRSQPRGPLRF